jgi:hypothetical protein
MTESRPTSRYPSIVAVCGNYRKETAVESRNRELLEVRCGNKELLEVSYADL